MFTKRKKAPEPFAPPVTPGLEPDSATREYFNRGGKIAVDRNRWFVVCMILAIGYLLFAAAFWQLIPLKKIEPVLVSTEESGRAFAIGAGNKPFQPGQESISYHIKEWVSNLWSINASTIDITQRAALRKIAGNAAQQVDAWLRANNPYVAIKNSPTTVRQIEPVSINFLKSDTVLFRFREVTFAASGASATTKTVAVTLQFGLKPPERREDVFENPLGLQIINFNATEESGSSRN